MLTCKGTQEGYRLLNQKHVRYLQAGSVTQSQSAFPGQSLRGFTKNIFGIYEWPHLVHGSRRGSNLFWLLAKRIPPRSEKKKALAAKYVHISQLR